MRQIFTSLELVAFTAATAVNGIRLFASPANMSATVPAACRAALSANVACTGADSFILAQGVVTGDTLLDSQAAEYCTASCLTALQAFQRNVDQRCGTTMYKMVDESQFEQSGAVLAMNVVQGYNLACIKDNDGYCVNDLFNGTKDACSDCSLQYLSRLLFSDFGRGAISNDSFSALLSQCGASPTKYPYTYTALPAPTGPGLPSPTDPAPPCRGTSYTVQQGDTCGSISFAQSVATDRMAALNGLDYNCTNLTPGRTLCIQDTCSTLHTVRAGDTCETLLAGKVFTLVQLVSWNPSIHYDCDNLDGMVGRNICLSPPGGGGYEVVPTSTKSRESLATSMISSWVSATWTTNAPNQTTVYSPVPTTELWYTTTAGLFNETLSNLTNARMAYCWLREEELVDPFLLDTLPGGCVRLVQTYCNADPDLPAPTSGPAAVPSVCTPARPVPTTEVEPPPPTPTPVQEGMVKGCREFYKVAGGDTCDKIRSQFGITLEQFYTWNPAVGTNCGALWGMYYVCVKGPA